MIEREPERSGPKIYVSRAVRGSRKNRAQQSGARSGRSRSGRGTVSEDHRNGNAERQNSSLRSAPCNARHRSNPVSAEKMASYIFLLIVYSHKVQLDSTTIKQSI